VAGDKILVVDDEEYIRDLVSSAFASPDTSR